MSKKMQICDFVKDYENNELVIPYIQRNYRWKANETRYDWDKSNQYMFQACEKGKRNTAHNLMYEICENYVNKKDMILGIVVLYEEKDKINNNKRQIIDGQQRLITLSLIMRFLCNQINNDNGVDKNWLKEECIKKNWYMLYFERDGEENKDRYNYMYGTTENRKSVDVKRMIENYEEIGRVYEYWHNKYQVDAEKIIEFINKNVLIIIRETDSKPIDEFLNMNSFKTPFSICDYVKVFLLNYAIKKGKKEEVLNLYREIAYYLYNSKYKEIQKVLTQGSKRVCVDKENTNNRKRGCDDEENANNRIDLLYEDNYKEAVDKEGVDSALVNDIYLKANIDEKEKIKTEEAAYNWEIKRLEYFRVVLKGLCEEYDNKNYNTLNMFNVLYRKTRKSFFSLFTNEVINDNKSFNCVINDTCKENIANYNCVIQSVKYSELHYEINNYNELYMNNNEDEKLKDIFKNCIDECSEIVEYNDKFYTASVKDKNYIEPCNKEINDNQENTQNFLENGKISIKKLFENDIIEKIVIPDIQRDYIKGCDNSYKGFDNFVRGDIQNNDSGIINTFISKYIEDKIVINIDTTKEYNKKWSISLSFKGNNEIINKESNDIDINKTAINCSDTYIKELKKHIKNAIFIEKEVYENIEDYNGTRYIKHYYQNRLYNEDYYNKLKEYISEVKGNVKSYCNNTTGFEENYTASCVVGYTDANNNLFVYDGQQRLTTFVIVYAYLSKKNWKRYLETLKKSLSKESYDYLYQEKGNEKLKNLKKYFFSGRPEANKALEVIFNWDVEKDEELLKALKGLVCNQTTYAIYKAIEKISKIYEEMGNIASEKYFYDYMDIELYNIDKQEETSQLFMDLNSGLALEPEEIYKSKLNYYLEESKNEGNKEVINNLHIFLDNSWLNAWINEINPEEKEIAALRNLFKWHYIARKNDFTLGEYEGKMKGSNQEDLEVCKKCFSDVKFINDIIDNYDYLRDKNKLSNFDYYDIKFKGSSAEDKKIYEPNIKIIKQDNAIRFYFKSFEDCQCIINNNHENLIGANRDLYLKIKYDLHEKGYIECKLDDESTENKKLITEYKLDKCENDFLSALTEMKDDIIAYYDNHSGTKYDFMGYEGYSQIEEKSITIDPEIFELESGEENIINQVIQRGSIEQLEQLFYTDSVKYSLKNLSEMLLEELNKEEYKTKLMKLFTDKYDLVKIDINNKESFIFYYKGNGYIKYNNEADIEIMGITITITKDDINNIKSLNINNFIDNIIKADINIISNDKKIRLLYRVLNSSENIDIKEDVKIFEASFYIMYNNFYFICGEINGGKEFYCLDNENKPLLLKNNKWEVVENVEFK